MLGVTAVSGGRLLVDIVDEKVINVQSFAYFLLESKYFRSSTRFVFHLAT